MKGLLVCCLLLAFFNAVAESQPVLDINWISVNPSNQMFVDELGRTRLFHGVNAVYKIPPWLPSNGPFNATSSLGPEDGKLLQSWGFNVVRLGVMWPGVQPDEPPAPYNKTYLQAARDIVDMLSTFGIYTIVDFHQDVFSRKFCGEGVPDWAVFPDPNLAPFAEPSVGVMAVDNVTGYPSLTDCLANQFSKYYPSAQVSAAFQRLYDNTNGLQDQLVAYWRQVALAFADAPSVLGYELINEPWPGDIYSIPEAVVPGYADKHFLSPMYQNVNDNAIRPVDDRHLIFFEDALVDLAYRTGFTPELTPGGVSYQDRQVLSFHVYCGAGDPESMPVCDGENEYFYAQAMYDVRKVGAGSMMTEFGAVTNATHGIDDIESLVNLADKHLQSWAYWQYKSYYDITTASTASGESFFDVDGQPEANKIKALSRAYAHAIAGVPTKQSFSRSGAYLLDYVLDQTIDGPTVIYANPDYYPNGYTVTAQTGVVTSTANSAGIWISVDGFDKAGGLVSNTIKISPKL